MATVGEIFRRSVSEQVGRSSAELHVLAVDDSHVDRKVIERLLKVSSCRVTAVESGTRALQYLGLDGEKTSAGFNDLKVNLIMTDYSMPGMTGYELLKKIKESSAFREIPVVVMSSENILTRIDRCLEEGAEEFIVKPVKLSDVTRLRDCIMRENTEKSTSTCISSSTSSKRKKEEEKTIKEEEDTMVKSPSLPSSPSTISQSSPKTPSPLISALQLTPSPTISPSKKPRLHNGDKNSVIKSDNAI